MAATHKHAIPKSVDEYSPAVGLRSIAVFEAIKGTLVLAAGFGALHYLHKDLGDAAERLVHWLHMNPSHHFGRVFIEAADKFNDGKLWALAGGALAYSTVRLVEAYGLWHRRVWAEWFALLSGAMYVPWELYEVIDKSTGFRWGVLLLNVLIVFYMAWIRITAWRRERA
jgi:uncharacterized membrane protein (DUF2068 family)